MDVYHFYFFFHISSWACMLHLECCAGVTVKIHFHAVPFRLTLAAL